MPLPPRRPWDRPSTNGATPWAPLRAAADLWHSASQPAEDLGTWTPLSQMPVPTFPSATSAQSFHELDEYAMDSVEVESEATAVRDDVDPIRRAPLRVLCGIEALDDHAGRWKSGGAYAPLSQDSSPDERRRGFPIGSALEIVGPPGCGKTTWAVQMAILERLQHIVHSMHVFLHEYEADADERDVDKSTSEDQERLDGHDGNEPAFLLPGSEHMKAATLEEAISTDIEPWCGQVVLVDTEGSIQPWRVLSMTRHIVAEHHLDTVRAFAQVGVANLDAAMDRHHLQYALERAVLRGVHLVRCTTLAELLAFLNMAASTVLKVPGLPPRTSLLILDTLSFFTYAHALPLNATREQRKAREDAIQSILRALTTLRDSHIPESERLTVVVTMQMSSRRVADMDSVLLPSLMPASMPAMRSAMCDDTESVLGRSAWRFVLSYSDVRAHRYVFTCVCVSV